VSDLTPCLSLWQPWATALFIDLEPDVPLKPHETRSWPLPAGQVGRTFAVHAAKRDTPAEREFWTDLDEEHREAFARGGFPSYESLPRGMLVGTVVYYKCLTTESLSGQVSADAYAWGNYGPDRFAYQTINRRLFKTPVPCVGRQGIWSVNIGGMEYRPL